MCVSVCWCIPTSMQKNVRRYFSAFLGSCLCAQPSRGKMRHQQKDFPHILSETHKWRVYIFSDYMKALCSYVSRPWHFVTPAWKVSEKTKGKAELFMVFDIICWDRSLAVLFWVYYVSCPVPIMQFDLNVGVLFLFETLSDGIIVLFLCSEVRVWEHGV